MESSFQNKPGIVRTHGYVFRSMQFPSYVPRNDGQNIPRHETRTLDHYLYGRHLHLFKNERRKHHIHTTSITTIERKRSLLEAQEMYFLGNRSRISRIAHLGESTTHGPSETRWHC